MYLSRTPAAHLSTWVDCLWANERGALAHAREHMLPSGCHQVVIALHEGSLLRFEKRGRPSRPPVRQRGVAGRARRAGAARHPGAVERGGHRAELALDAGYADQAQLANEFRRLGGLTPTA